MSVHVLSSQADVLLEKGEIKADEIWKIYNSSPRLPQVCSQLMFNLKICFHNQAYEFWLSLVYVFLAILCPLNITLPLLPLLPNNILSLLFYFPSFLIFLQKRFLFIRFLNFVGHWVLTLWRCLLKNKANNLKSPHLQITCLLVHFIDYLVGLTLNHG